jgi:hypothetical protein
MKKLILAFALAFTAIALPVTQTGCMSTQQQTAYITLDATGKAAKASMDASTQLLKQGVITVVQWQKIANDYDSVFQPAYGLAVAAAGTASAPAPQALVDQQTALAASVKTLTP